MATVEAPPGTLGPKYALDDPTLPESWRGLIDGNTGVMYYWNPETNATQYEKPPPLQYSDNIQTPQHTPMQPMQQGFMQPMQPGLPQGPYQLMQSMPHVQQGQMYPGAQMGKNDMIFLCFLNCYQFFLP
ncbi:dead box ATP-dependent RNA helicase [Striga asiatica]|uniref:Dead box ATP-dependent RNA helicase n=1 Tax=Striga asiatica TaxID=4170 RepID=A0A5A7Q5Q6_STRAF|nr:dead box ATP-dependent RNA helicase [Striga asiatica]